MTLPDPQFVRLTHALEAHDFAQAHNLLEEMEDEWLAAPCLSCGYPHSDCLCGVQEARYLGAWFYEER
jgi:hypothetical protein